MSLTYKVFAEILRKMFSCLTYPLVPSGIFNQMRTSNWLSWSCRTSTSPSFHLKKGIIACLEFFITLPIKANFFYCHLSLGLLGAKNMNRTSWLPYYKRIGSQHSQRCVTVRAKLDQFHTGSFVKTRKLRNPYTPGELIESTIAYSKDRLKKGIWKGKIIVWY